MNEYVKSYITTNRDSLKQQIFSQRSLVTYKTTELGEKQPCKA